MHSAVVFVCRNIICIAVLFGLSAQYFYAPSYWTFVLLSGISLLEKRVPVKITLVIIITCAYLVKNMQTKRVCPSADGYVTDNLAEDRSKDKRIFTECSDFVDSDVFVLKLNSEREKKFLKLVHRLYDKYNAIVFSCKIDKKVLGLFLTQLFDFNYYRAIASSSLNTSIDKDNILLTYIAVSATRWFFRVSYRKEYAVVLSRMGPDLSFQVFDSLRRVGGSCKPKETHLNFIKFYPQCTWNKLRKLMTNCSDSTQLCYTFNNDELDHYQYEQLCELLCIHPRDYNEFRFLFATRDELRSMVSVSKT